MLRRMAWVVGFVLLTSTALAVPAHADQTCPEVDEEPAGDTDKPKGSVATAMDGNFDSDGDGDFDGDPDGEGTITLTFLDQYKTEDGEQVADVAYVLDTTNVETPLHGTHIHAVGNFETIVIEFFNFEEDPDRSGVITISKCLAHDIFNQPEDFFADVHNEAFNGGAIRGGPLVNVG